MKESEWIEKVIVCVCHFTWWAQLENWQKTKTFFNHFPYTTTPLISYYYICIPSLYPWPCIEVWGLMFLGIYLYWIRIKYRHFMYICILNIIIFVFKKSIWIYMRCFTDACKHVFRVGILSRRSCHKKTITLDGAQDFQTLETVCKATPSGIPVAGTPWIRLE